MQKNILGSVVDLNHPGHYVHWGFIQLSVANLVVIGLMVVVFVLALILPFPHAKAAPNRARPETRPPDAPSGGTPR
jgi:hypothetical protein